MSILSFSRAYLSHRHPDVARDLHRMLVEYKKENNVVEDLLEPRLELRL